MTPPSNYAPLRERLQTTSSGGHKCSTAAMLSDGSLAPRPSKTIMHSLMLVPESELGSGYEAARVHGPWQTAGRQREETLAGQRPSGLSYSSEPSSLSKAEGVSSFMGTTKAWSKAGPTHAVAAFKRTSFSAESMTSSTPAMRPSWFGTCQVPATQQMVCPEESSLPMPSSSLQ